MALKFCNDVQYEDLNPVTVRNIDISLQEFIGKKNVGFKGECYFVPMVYDWLWKGGKVVGTLVIKDPSRHPEEARPKHPSDDRYKETKMQFSQKSARALDCFINCLLCDLRKRKSEQELRNLVSFSSLEITRYGDLQGW